MEYRKANRDEVLMVHRVPPSKITIVENANLPRLRPVPDHIQRKLSENRGYDWSRWGTVEFYGATRLKHVAPPVGGGVFGLGLRCVLCLEDCLFQVWGVRARWAGAGESISGFIPVCDDCWEGKEVPDAE